jgi:hypothetical protein
MIMQAMIDPNDHDRDEYYLRAAISDLAMLKKLAEEDLSCHDELIEEIARLTEGC